VKKITSAKEPCGPFRLGERKGGCLNNKKKKKDLLFVWAQKKKSRQKGKRQKRSSPPRQPTAKEKKTVAHQRGGKKPPLLWNAWGEEEGSVGTPRKKGGDKDPSGRTVRGPDEETKKKRKKRLVRKGRDSGKRIGQHRTIPLMRGEILIIRDT